MEQNRQHRNSITLSLFDERNKSTPESTQTLIKRINGYNLTK